MIHHRIKIIDLVSGQFNKNVITVSLLDDWEIPTTRASDARIRVGNMDGSTGGEHGWGTRMGNIGLEHGCGIFCLSQNKGKKVFPTPKQGKTW